MVNFRFKFPELGVRFEAGYGAGGNVASQQVFNLQALNLACTLHG